MSPVHISTLDGSIWMSRNTVWISDFCNSASSYGEIIGKTTHKQQMEQHHSPVLFIIYSYEERGTSDKAWVGRNERKTTLFSRLEAAIFDQETMMRVQLWRRIPGREFPVHVTVKCTWLKNDLISGVSGTPSRSQLLLIYFLRMADVFDDFDPTHDDLKPKESDSEDEVSCCWFPEQLTFRNLPRV